VALILQGSLRGRIGIAQFAAMFHEEERQLLAANTIECQQLTEDSASVSSKDCALSNVSDAQLS
jgi:hypothetical protein